MNSFELMHKNVPVLMFQTKGKQVDNVTDVYNIAHVPVGALQIDSKSDYGYLVNKVSLDKWLGRRYIPSSRHNINRVLQNLEMSDVSEIWTRTLGFSLSDQYWFRPLGSELKWEEVNFFNNSFSEDVGNLLVEDGIVSHIDMSTPDVFADGVLQKRWKIINGKRCLMKQGSGPFNQEPYNEKICSILCECLNIPHVHYELIKSDSGKIYSSCETVISDSEDLVKAGDLLTLKKQSNNITKLTHYANICEELGVKDISLKIDMMLLVDYISHNTDRHWGNFGLIRNSETLEYVGCIPLFDHGNSLWYDSPINEIGKQDCKSICAERSIEKTLDLIKKADCFDIESIKDFPEIVADILSDIPDFSEKRIEKIKNDIIDRLNNVEKHLIKSKNKRHITMKSTKKFKTAISKKTEIENER